MMNLDSLSERSIKLSEEWKWLLLSHRMKLNCNCHPRPLHYVQYIVLSSTVTLCTYSTILDRYIMYCTILDHYKSMFGNGIVLTNYVSHLLLMHCHSFFINWIKSTNNYVHIALYINSGVWQLMNAVAAAPIALWLISHPRAYSWALPSRRHSLSDDQSWCSARVALSLVLIELMHCLPSSRYRLVKSCVLRIGLLDLLVDRRRFKCRVDTLCASCRWVCWRRTSSPLADNALIDRRGCYPHDLIQRYYRWASAVIKHGIGHTTVGSDDGAVEVLGDVATVGPEDGVSVIVYDVTDRHID
jgi:hypothetical protein